MLSDRDVVCVTCGRAISSPTPFTCPWCGSLHTVPHTPTGQLCLPLLKAPRLSLRSLAQNNIPVIETPYLTLGGGLGSFAWADYLRVSGVSAEQITVIGNKSVPYTRFQRLCANSQINDQERIRSDSGARPDNVWGWPGYAVQEIATLLRHGQVREASRIAWQILAEPALADVYTPRAALVFASLEREMKRIGWPQMVRQGEIGGVRQTDDGRFAAAYIPHRPGRPSPAVVVAPYLHLALGYPGIHLAPETQAYRQATGDTQLVVQAYEEHEHIYQQLGERGGLLILRGRGIVASRILQRVDEIRQATGHNIQVVHLLRAPLTEDTVYGSARRQTRYHMQWQPFNWPKAMFGGDLRAMLAEATPAERQTLLANWGGVTTSNRTDWQELVARGEKEGWYRVCFGEVEKIRGNGRGRVVTHICTQNLPEVEPQPARLVADFVLDCTGLNTALRLHPILNDLCEQYQLPLNPSGQLALSHDFELTRLRNGEGRVFMAGVMAFGNGFAPVDSFSGLQYAAQRSVDALTSDHAPGLHRLNGLHSLHQWLRWLRGFAPYG